MAKNSKLTGNVAVMNPKLDGKPIAQLLTSGEKSTTSNEPHPLRAVANKLAKGKHADDTEDIIIDGVDTKIPNNLPVAIIGEKGSGKTTLIKALIEKTQGSTFSHIIYVYSNGNMNEELPPEVIKVNVKNALSFLSLLFESKALFVSYYKFFRSIDFKKLGELEDKEELTDADIMKACDNVIYKYNEATINSKLQPVDKFKKVVDVGVKTLKSFSQPFFIDNIMMSPLNPNDLDALFIDDIAIASEALFTSLRNNKLYEYFTISRHIHMFICLAGQQIDQIPKFMRKEIMTWILSKNTQLERLEGVIPKAQIKKIAAEQTKLQGYEFILYDIRSGETSTV